MILPRIKAKRFFRLFDQLSVYAHQRLHVVDDSEFFTGEKPRGIGEAGQRATMAELWSHPDIIDDFVRDNPASLAPSDLATVSSWKSAYHGNFLVGYGPDGILRFLYEDHAFEVCGMSLEIGKMLNRVPAVVSTTLLPYGSHVVYDQTLGEVPVELSEGIRESIERELREAIEQGRVVATGEQLVAVAPLLQQRRTERELEDFRHELEMEERAAGPHEGQRAGALVGLSDEERDRAIMDHMHEMDGLFQKKFPERLDERCVAGPMRTSLDELVQTGRLPSAEEVVSNMEEQLARFTESDALDSTELAVAREALETAIQEQRDRVSGPDGVLHLYHEHYTTPSELQRIIEGLVSPQLVKLRALAEAGGRQSWPLAELNSFEKVPLPTPGLCYLFHEGDDLHAIMPDEVVPLARELDWEAAFEADRSYLQLTNFFDAICDLRGIAPLADAVDEYLTFAGMPDEEAQDVTDTLIAAMQDEQVPHMLLDDGETLYLVHYELIWEQRRKKGLEPTTNELYLEEKPGRLLSNLLAHHKGKEPRPVLAEMIEDANGVFGWRERQAPARALRDFLDAHVPDGADEYLFADNVMEGLLEEQRWGIAKGSVEAFFGILEDNGLIPDESQVQQLLTLWQNLCNALPVWPNNGWSPNELLHRETGRRMFFNPDGSVMRVGRNDPCPCGSGKKYKRCCGR